MFAEAEAGKHCAHLRIERVAVESVETLLQQGVSFSRRVVFGAGMIQLGHLPSHAFDLRLHGAQFVEDGEAFLEDRSPAEAQALLRKVADAHATRLLHLAVIERLKAGQHFHERRLAGAVGADQRSPLLAADEPVGLKKQDAGAESLAGILQREH